MNLLTQHKDLESRSLIFRQWDIAARLVLLEMAEREYKDFNPMGCRILMDAEAYLSDRLAYQLWPPPWHAQLLPEEK
jgi:hypothetical protein